MGSDGGEEVPVGFPGVEKGADSVVREVAVTRTLMRLIRLMRLLRASVASVGYLRDVPVGDLGGPAGDGAT